MSARRPASAVLVAAAAMLLAVIAPAAAPAAVPAVQDDPAADDGTAPDDSATVELEGQTPVVRPGGRVEFRLRFDGVPEDAFVQLELHHRVTSRSEFERSIDGEGLRPRISPGSPMRVAELPLDPATGARSVQLALDPESPGGISVPTAGAYPVRIRVTDADARTLTSAMSHVVVVDDADESPPLAVAVVADLGAEPALRPDGTVELASDDLAALEALAAVLDDAPDDVPVTMALRPETLDALAAGDHQATLDRLRRIAERGSVLEVPYVDLAVQSVVDAGLLDELDAALERGRVVLREELGVTELDRTWIAEADLGPEALGALADRGFERYVFDREMLQAAPASALSLAQRFGVTDRAPEGSSDVLSIDAPTAVRVGSTGLDGIEVDPLVAARFHDDGSPAALAQRIVAELAVIWIEQPAVARGVVLQVDRETSPEVLGGVLAGLHGAGVLDPTPLEVLFDRTDPLTDPSGAEVLRALRPEEAPGIDERVVAGLGEVRTRLAGYESLVGSDSPRALPMRTHLLVALGRDLGTARRMAHLDAVSAEVDEVAAGIQVPPRAQLTLTSREATFPLTIQNGTGFPVRVVAHLDSAKLEFPHGEAVELTLEEPTTRVDLAVRTLASGGFPLDVVITSPDGSVELASTRYTIQSTAVSGVGLVISIGAGLFLLGWWVSHWHRTRRSRRLVPLPAGPDSEPVG